MYGLIHVVIRELVKEKFGEHIWTKVLETAGLGGKDFLTFQNYHDNNTEKLLQAVATHCDMSVEKVLEVFGVYFVEYCLRHHYDKMLRTLGSDVRSFVQNLDSLHTLLAMNYKNMRPPSFRCETHPDGSMELHYYSVRKGYYPLVIGLLSAVGKLIFQQTVELSVVERVCEQIEGGATTEHTIFHVTTLEGTGDLVTDDVRLRDCSKSMDGSELSTSGSSLDVPPSFCIPPAAFCSLFPFHVSFDENLQIKQVGNVVKRFVPCLSHPGHSVVMGDVFRLHHPTMLLSAANIRKFINAVFILGVGKGMLGNSDERELRLRGQMMWLKDTHHFLFLCSPQCGGLTELSDLQLRLDDIPLYDATREMLIINQERKHAISVTQQLDEAMAELQEAEKALRREKARTEELLHRMLPPKVACKLQAGQTVEAEKFDSATVLFANIDKLPDMAASHPFEMVRILDALYQCFDGLTSKFDVYKVETSGDSYMAVGGVPETREDHAERMCSLALDMQERASEFCDPFSGSPIKIRVGLHSGALVAGVVGHSKPRYCLFGDTVNTASRMESHGVAGRIHVSPTTRRALQSGQFVFEERGQIVVKGKGRMTTYFLIGHRLDLICCLSEDSQGSQGTDGKVALATFSKRTPVKYPRRRHTTQTRFPAGPSEDLDSWTTVELFESSQDGPHFAHRPSSAPPQGFRSSLCVVL